MPDQVSTRGPMPRWDRGLVNGGWAWPVWRVFRYRVGEWSALQPTERHIEIELPADRTFPTHAEALAYALEQATGANLPASRPEPEQLPATYAERAAQGWEYQHIEGDHWDWRKADA